MKNKNQTQPKKHPSRLRFTIDSGLLVQLGEQLVSKPSIALGEVIKNSYDADAQNVQIRFEQVTTSKGSIIIKDDGHGMTFETIRDSWMRIAHNQKAVRDYSPKYCRPQTGAKGVGRFALRRLSHKLTMISVAEREDGKKERIVIRFKWQKFVAGKTLDKISVRYRRVSVSKDTQTGLELHLTELKDIWTESEVKTLQSELLTLNASPFESDTSTLYSEQLDFGCKPDPGFRMIFFSDEFNNLSGELNQRFLEQAWGVLEGYVTEDGNAQYKLLTKHDSKELSFQFNPKDVHKQGEPTSYQLIPKAYFKIYFYVYKSDYFTGFKLRDIARYGRENSGIRIYLDKFRIFPFGGFNDDWLGLSLLRAERNTTTPEFLIETAKNLTRPFLFIPSTNQLLGAVHISQSQHKEIQIPVNRQGLIDNDAFKQLRAFVRNGIFWMTIEYVRYQSQQPKPKESLSKEAISDRFQKLAEFVSNSKELDSSSRAEVVQLITLAKESVESQELEFMSELSTLRILASSGTAILIFQHQLQSILNGLKDIVKKLEELSVFIPENQEKAYIQIIESIKQWIILASEQASHIGLLSGVEVHGSRTILSIYNTVEDVIKPLHSYAEEFGIAIENHCKKGLRTPPMFKAELFAILLNILTNALKAVLSVQDRRVRFVTDQTSKSLMVTLLDSGVGIPKEERQLVFEPLYSTRMPDPVLGIGTGLGLAIVRDLVKIYGGTAEFIDAPDNWKTAIQITLPMEK
jgi:signal transduction histidine kinase